MGKKYIIELEDELFTNGNLPFDGSETLYRVKGFNSLVFDQNGLNKLTPLDDALDSAYAHGAIEAEAKYHKIAEQVKEEAYQKGLEDGRDDPNVTLDCKYEWYQRGLNDAWECARNISTMDNAQQFERFGEHGEANIFGIYSASEAIQRIKEWEEKQKEEDEIKVGDEVIACGRKAIVTKMSGTRIDNYIDEYGRTYTNVSRLSDEFFEKTGRHFDEIETVLSKMRSEKDDTD